MSIREVEAFDEVVGEDFGIQKKEGEDGRGKKTGRR